MGEKRYPRAALAGTVQGDMSLRVWMKADAGPADVHLLEWSPGDECIRILTRQEVRETSGPLLSTGYHPNVEPSETFRNVDAIGVTDRACVDRVMRAYARDTFGVVEFA
jgi:hypothetical protein